MFKEPYDIVSLEKHSDIRGDLFEIFKFKNQKLQKKGYVYSFSINPGERRGDHYHTKKKEWFTCVYGEATILVEDKEGGKNKIILNADNPKLLYFGPYTAHAVLNQGKEVAVIVSYGSKQHDINDEDTFKKFIEI
jgi:dTDP-4-dehydrorhamnose 3,5-epimerase